MKILGQHLNSSLEPQKVKNGRGRVNSPLKYNNVTTPTFRGGFVSKGINFDDIGAVLKKIFIKDTDSIKLAKESLGQLDKIFDGKVSKLIDDVENISGNIKTSTTAKIVKNGSEISNIQFDESPITVRLLKKIIYPVYPGLIKDAPNAIIDKLQSFNAFKDSKILNSLKDSKFLSSARTVKESDKMINSLYGILKKQQTLDLKGQDVQEGLEKFYLNMFGGSKGNYSNQSERALNALATATVSGIFSANDFYNTSRFHYDDDKKAEKARDDRLKYELKRGILKAGASFATAGALSKYTNSNKAAAIANLMLTTLVIEVGSRLISKKHLLPLTKKQAEEEYYKQNMDKTEDTHTVDKMNSSLDKNSVETSKQTALKDAKKVSSKGAEHTNLNNSNSKEKNGSALKTVLKIFGGIILVGFAKSAATKYIKGADKFFNDIISKKNNIFDAITVRKYKMDKNTVNSLLAELRKNGKNNFATLFENGLKSATEEGGNYIVKTKNSFVGKIVKPFVALTDIVKKPFAVGENLGKKIFNVKTDTSRATAKTQDAVIDIYKKLTKKTGNTREVISNLASKTDKIITNGFDINTSILDTRELVRKYVFFNTLIPSYFFVNDYRNDELIQAKGENTDRVKEVTEKRIMHRIVNYFSNRVFIEAFFALTGNLFNSSLLAATGITALTELTNETVIRKIIGVPLGKKSKAQIEEFEREASNNKFRMAVKNMLGKKSITEKAGGIKLRGNVKNS